MQDRTSEKTIKTKISKSTIHHLINITILFFILNALSQNIASLNQSLSLLFSLYFLAGFFAFNISRQTISSQIKNKQKQQTILIGFLLILSCSLLLLTTQTMLWITSIPLFLSAIALLQQKKQEKTFIMVLLIATIFYTMIYIFLQSIPQLYLFFTNTSLQLTKTLGSLIGTPLLLGPSASGLWTVLVTIPFLIVFSLLSPKKHPVSTQIKIVLLSITTLFLLWIFYIILSNYLIDHQYISLLILFLCCLTPLFIFFIPYKDEQQLHIIDPFNTIKPRKIQKQATVLIAIVLFFSVFTLTVFIEHHSSTEKKPTILFYGQNMLGTWDIPHYGTYGHKGIGMFGLLPMYLQTSDYTCEIAVQNITTFLEINQPEIPLIGSPNNTNTTSNTAIIPRYVNLTDTVKLIETSTITDSVLENVDIFVVINLNTSFSSQEKQSISTFIKNGGSLLVLGDHTNVGGIQEPLNHLLQEVGITFNFDSALPLDNTFRWLTSSHLLHHPIVSTIQNPHELQIGVGASLDVGSPSFPIIIGRYAFSDIGDETNEDFGYLGDYVYTKGEQLGDIVLAAGSYYGKGKIIVFGDTSSFQNTALPYSYSFINQVFSWLSTTHTSTHHNLKIVIALFLGIIAFIFLILKKQTLHILPMLSIILCFSLICSAAVNSHLLYQKPPQGPLAYIDTSHIQRFNIEAFTDQSLSGLLLNLQRNGYLPLYLHDFSSEKLTHAHLLILNAPTKPFSSQELSTIQQFMKKGGIVILATGYHEKHASQSLLELCGLDIQPVPLGPVPYLKYSSTAHINQTRFVNSYPIIDNAGDAISFYSFNFTRNDDDTTEYHLMMFAAYNAGGLLLISDSSYLYDNNIESIYDYWPGNIIMLKNILDEFKERGENI